MKKVLIGILIFLIFLGSVGVGIYLSSKYVSGNNTENIFQAIENGIREDIKNKKEEKEPVTIVIEPKEDIKVRMSVIGDIMCHNSQYNDAYRNGEYDFSYVFEDIKPYIENADIAIGNLETTFAGAERGYSSYPTEVSTLKRFKVYPIVYKNKEKNLEWDFAFYKRYYFGNELGDSIKITREEFEALGGDLMGMSPEQYQDYENKEREEWFKETKRKLKKRR